jgi:hypothetical protein
MLIKYITDTDLNRISFWDLKTTHITSNSRLTTLQSTLAKSIEAIYQRDKGGYDPFYKLVDEVKDNAPQYYNTVPVPMYLELIISRLNNCFYSNIDSIKFDISLISKNCLTYNNDKSILSKYAKQLVSNILNAFIQVDSHNMNISSNTRHSRLTRNIDMPVLEELTFTKSLRSRNNIKIAREDIELSIDDDDDESEEIMPRNGRFLRNKRHRSNTKFRINI